MAGFVAYFNGEWVPQAEVKVSPTTGPTRPS